MTLAFDLSKVIAQPSAALPPIRSASTSGNASPRKQRKTRAELLREAEIRHMHTQVENDTITKHFLRSSELHFSEMRVDKTFRVCICQIEFMGRKLEMERRKLAYLYEEEAVRVQGERDRVFALRKEGDKFDQIK